MPSEDILDMTLVNELRDIMGEGFAALVQSYQRDVESKLAELQAALTAGEYSHLRQVAHSLKGSSGNLGALQAAAACQTLEQVAESADSAALVAALEQVASTTDAALQALQELG